MQTLAKDNNNRLNERIIAIRKSCDALVHHYQCPNNTECKIISCGKIKKLKQHENVCRRASCGICKQFKALISYHSKTCLSNTCPIEKCAEFKLLREQLR